MTRWQDVEERQLPGVKGAFLLTQTFLPTMVRQGGGTIVNVLSTALDGRAPKGFPAYVLAKSALEGLTRALAAEYHGKGIRVFSVSPGFMDTPLTRSWNDHLRATLLGQAAFGSVEKAADDIVRLTSSPTTVGDGENYHLE